MYLSGEIEKWGSGIKSVYKECKDDKIDIVFENRKTAFFVVVYRKELEELVENTEKNLQKNVTVNVPVNVPVNLNMTEKKVLILISENPNITQKEIASKLGLNEKTIKRNTAGLKQKGILERVGADKNGYWKIIR